MPFAALDYPTALAVSVPLAAAGYLAQELWLRRRTGRQSQTPGRPRRAGGSRRLVRVGPAASTDTEPPTGGGLSVALARATRPRGEAAGAARPARQRPAAKAAVAKAAGERAGGARAGGARPGGARAGGAKVALRAARRPKPKPSTVTAAELGRREAYLAQALEAVIEFVESQPIRTGARACADALVLLVPKAERGLQLAAFLRAAGAKESPARLQALAEDVGIELAAGLKRVRVELKSLLAP